MSDLVMQKLRTAFQCFQGRDFPGVERLVGEILRDQPQDSRALHLLGLALAEQGRIAEAVGALRGAAAAAPGDPDILLNLANMRAGQGAFEDALTLYQNLLALQPRNAIAHFNIGNLHRMAGRLGEAAAAYRESLAIAPDDPHSHNNLGLVYERQGRLEEAISCYRRALALDPRQAYAYVNLGNALRLLGQLDEAAAACERALVIEPHSVDALINLGNVRAEQQRFTEAQALYERALRADPQAAEVHRNLGALYTMQGRLREALASYRAALGLAPDQAAIHAELARILRESGDLEGAVAAYRRAVAIDPASAWIHCDLADTHKVLGRLDEAAAGYRRALALKPGDARALGALVQVNQHQCNWDGIEESWERLRVELAAHSDAVISPFTVLSLPATAAEQLACAAAWARKNVEPMALARSALGFDFSARGKRERLRIGYLSWGFHSHATSYWIAELPELHDRSRFEVFAYDYGPDDGSEIRARLRKGFDRFVEIRDESHLDAARRIHGDGVDILVDLTGYTLGARPQILAMRPAPVQVSWFYPGTMGTGLMDYFIADPIVVPAGAERFFAERVVRLPDCYMITDRRRAIADTTPRREECGLPERGFVFCCFNQAYKILPDAFSLWMRILRSVPDSVLWLAEANPWATRNLRRAAIERGVAAERIVFAPRRPLPDYLAQHRLADLALDTFPYTSHSTAADALWMGCPLVTCVGETFASRVAGSVLINAGMGGLVTESFADYERLAIELATRPERLQDVRRKLQENRNSCPLFDTPRFVRNLERAYEQMFRAFEDGKA